MLDDANRFQSIINENAKSLDRSKPPEAPMPKIKEELTPSALRCSIGACPAVFSLDDGNLLIVGKKLSPELAKETEGKVSDDEHAIVLSPDFFKDLGK